MECERISRIHLPYIRNCEDLFLSFKKKKFAILEIEFKNMSRYCKCHEMSRGIYSKNYMLNYRENIIPSSLYDPTDYVIW